MTIENAMIARARYFQMAAHEAIGQKRKHTDEPYWVHPQEVADILIKLGGFTPIEIQAALLHDVLEDTKVQKPTLAVLFGSSVVSLVVELTNVTTPEDGNREKRSAIERERLSKVSASAQSIKVADMISNSRTIVKHDKAFAKVFIAEKEALLDVLTQADKRLLLEARHIVDQAKAELEK